MTAAKRFGLIGIFASPEALVTAAKRLRLAGFSAVEAYTPYPVEGLDELVHPGPKRLLPALIFAGGIVGAGAGYFIQYWAEVLNYPINVGGRPYNSWPAFIVPAFEITVLFALAAGFFALFLTCRLPRLYHPIFEANAFERVSQDRFALSVAASDPRFEPARIRSILEGCGAERVEEVPPAAGSAPIESPKARPRQAVVFGALCLALAALVALVSCDNMANQPKRLPFELPFGAQAQWPVLPPEGIVAHDETAPPGPPPVTLALLRRGQQRFDIYCAPCHGRDGDGHGMIVQRGFPNPPSYFSERLRQAPIQHFYDVMTHGYGVMFSYAARVAPEDRWAIAAYIRALQASNEANLADVPPDQRKDLK